MTEHETKRPGYDIAQLNSGHPRPRQSIPDFRRSL